MTFSFRYLILGAAALLPGIVARAETSQDVIVYSYTTDAGKKFTPPTADHPAYYLLMDGGYREEGEPIAGETKPAPARVEKLVRHALDTAHYVGVSQKSPRLDVILVYHWGYISPTEDKETETEYERKRRIALVGGKPLLEMSYGEFGRDELMQAAGDERYFIVISAFDFSAAQQKKKVLLWRAQISGSSNHTSLDEVLPGFLTAGAPLFGRDSGLPSEHIIHVGQKAEVDVGTPTVQEYFPTVELPAPKKDSPTPAPKKP